MSRRLNVSFSLLRLMLCCTLFAATLGLGLALGASRDVPLLASATAASLLAFVLRWRQLPVIIFSGMCTVFGAGFGRPVIYNGTADDRWVQDLHGSISGAIFGWIFAAVIMRVFFAKDFAYRMTADGVVGSRLETRTNSADLSEDTTKGSPAAKTDRDQER